MMETGKSTFKAYKYDKYAILDRIINRFSCIDRTYRYTNDALCGTGRDTRVKFWAKVY